MKKIYFTLIVLYAGLMSAYSSHVKYLDDCPAPTITYSGATTICLGETVTLTSSSAENNLWSNGETTQSVTVNRAGVFTVKTITTGCTSDLSAPVIISLNEAPVISVEGAATRSGCTGVILSGPEPALVTTLAGSSAGMLNDTGTAARFRQPLGIGVMPDGSLLVSDYGNGMMRKISVSGVTSTFGTNTSFFAPAGMYIDGSGTTYLCEAGRGRIHVIAANGSSAIFAGTLPGYNDGPILSAKFRYPAGITADASGNFYVADYDNHVIRKISPVGIVSTFAGMGETLGYADGVGSAARFFHPYGITSDNSGNLFVTESGNHKIRKITPDGTVTTIAGSVIGYADGPANEARFSSPCGIDMDVDGNFYIADLNNNRIRKLSADGQVTTLIGDTAGNTDGTFGVAQLQNPYLLQLSNDGYLYVADFNNNRIRKIDLNKPGFDSWYWVEGSTSREFSPAISGSYAVKSVLRGCTSAAGSPVTVTIGPAATPVISYVSDMLDAGPGGLRYFWFHGLDYLANDSGRYLQSPVVGGSYTVSMRDSNGCQTGESVAFEVTATTEKTPTAIFRIVPNPAGSRFRIAGIAPGTKIEISNVTGQKLISISGDSETYIDVQNLAAGLYNVNIGTGVLKLVKDR
ncbi:MAG: T9SS type A sorting domain-containing protein [Bacteroidota bacterium]